MCLKKVTTEITYRVPAWGHCNQQGNVLGQPSKEKCRFCVKEKGEYRCALYNEVLRSEGPLVYKARDCERATAGFKSKVEDVESTPMPTAEPKDIIKTAIAEYSRMRKLLLNQGYPETIADKLAHNYVVGGK